MPSAHRINNVADARRLARRTIPRAVFDYIDGAAEDEVTAGENERGFREIAFRPRMAVKVDSPKLETTVLGTRVSMPVLLAPCGLVGLMHPDGAIGAARAGRRAGTISVLSTVAGTPPEGLAGEPGPRWFQLYAANRDIARGLISRATDTGFDGLVVTVDTPALGKRERDARNGVAGSFALTPRSAAILGPQILARPGWAMRMARRSLKTLGRTPLPGGAPDASVRGYASRAGSVVPRSTTSAEPATSAEATAELAGGHDETGDGAPVGAVSSAGAVAMLASPFTWDDVAWIREQWSGPLVVKGVLSGSDALLAAKSGADAVIVSNHGGRQLEGAPATIRVLPEVVEAVGDQAEVLMDGGVRRGGDVLKALALGARAVLIGRPYLYALAASGEAGVDRILEVFRLDMARTLALLGCGSVNDLDRSWLQS
jgi:L-lactate dehydrogenase (cytochrome)